MPKCGDDVYYEPTSKKKKLTKKGHTVTEKTEIVYNRGKCYRIRFAKDGVKWHSEVDPNRPDSPIVEYPEYPDTENQDGTSTIFGTVDEEEMQREMKSVDEKYDAYLRKKNKKKNVQPEPVQDVKSFMDTAEPMESLSDAMDSVHLQQYPGLYPGDMGTFSPIGSGGGHEFDEY